MERKLKRQIKKYMALILALCLAILSSGSAMSAYAWSGDGEENKVVLTAEGESREESEDPGGIPAAELGESSLGDSKAAELSYTALYIMRHADRRYVDPGNMNLAGMASPVTCARGIATYNEHRQIDFNVQEGSFLAGIAYELPVYDVDSASDYYVCVPDVNLYNDDFGSYDLTLAYNNNSGETIEGYKYTEGIMYIPKAAVDDPQNVHDAITASPIAVQLNYFFRNGGADYSKDVPVQILAGNVPESMTAHVENIFADDSVSIEIGNYDKSRVSVMLNGMIMPISREAFDIEGGVLTIYSSPAVISNINVVISEAPLVAALLDRAGELPVLGGLGQFVKKSAEFLTGKAYADTYVSPDKMKYFKTASGRPVTLNADLSNLYVGWRGYYENAKVKYSGASRLGSSNEARIKKLMALKGWMNSVDYMYGAYVEGNTQGTGNPQELAGIWAINSYTLGVNKALNTSDRLTADMLVSNDVEGDGGQSTKKTIYAWMRQYAQKLELNNGQVGDTRGDTEQGPSRNSNGIGGFTNFAFQFPKKVKGSDTNLVPTGEEGHGRSNPDISFASDEIDSSYYIAASCSQLDEDAGATDSDDDNTNTVYVACLAKGADYAVFSFATATSWGHGQDGAAIYKFKTGCNVKVRKRSGAAVATTGNACYSMKGTEFKLYEDRDSAIGGTGEAAVFVLDENGESKEETIPSGKYYLVETKAGKGYSIPDEYSASSGGKEVTVSGSENVFEIEAVDWPRLCQAGVLLRKQTGDFPYEHAEGGASLAGAVYRFSYYDGAYSNVSAAESSGEPFAVWYFETTEDEDGKASISGASPKLASGYTSAALIKDASGRTAFPIGTYIIEEVRPPEGYLADGEKYLVKISDVPGSTAAILDTYNSGNGAVVSGETVIRGGVSVVKRDKELGKSEAIGGASPEGIVMTIRNVSDHEVVVRKDLDSGEILDWSPGSTNVEDGKAVVIRPGEDVGKLTIRWDPDFVNKDGSKGAYAASTAPNDLPYGEYTIRESVTTASYQRTDKTEHEFRIERNGVIVTPESDADLYFDDFVYRGDIKGVKIGEGTNERLAFVPFLVTNLATGEAHVIVTDENGAFSSRDERSEDEIGSDESADGKRAVNAFDDLIGNKEVKNESEAGNKPEGSSGAEDASQAGPKEAAPDAAPDEETSEPETADSAADPVISETEPEESPEPAAGETASVVIEASPEPAAEETAPAETEAPDPFSKAALSARAAEISGGVWFGLGENGSEAPPDASCGALPYGRYRIEELPCEANSGYELIEPFEFSVNKASRTSVIDLGTLTDQKRTPETSYKMWKVRNEKAPEKAETGRYGFLAGNVVTYTVFVENTGELLLAMDISDKFESSGYFSKPEIVSVSGAETTDGGKDKYVAHILLEPGKTAEIVYKSTILPGTDEYLASEAADSDSLDGDGKPCNYTCEQNSPDDHDGYINTAYTKNVVPKDPDRPKEKYPELPDQEDPAQTPVQSPEIGTIATSDGEHEAEAAKKVPLVDTIQYEGFAKNEEVIVEGKVMVKQTGEPLKIKGKEVTAKAVFNTGEGSGEWELDFGKLDLRKLGDKTLVVFERAYQKRPASSGKTEKVLVVDHSDLENEAQSVTITASVKPKKPEKEKDSGDKPKKTVTKRTNTYKGDVPDTGDKNDPAMFILLFVTASALAAAMFKLKR